MPVGFQQNAHSKDYTILISQKFFSNGEIPILKSVMNLKAGQMIIDRKYFELKKEISDLISSNANVNSELMIRVLIESAVDLASQRQDSNEVDLVNDLIDETLRLFYRALDDRKHKKKLTLRSAAIL